MKRWLTVGNVLATAAVVVAVSGATIATVQAARSTAPRAKAQYTGAQVRNESLTGRDVRNGTLTSGDFSSATKTQLKALTGPKGAPGPTGPAGNPGGRGQPGADGVSAARSYSYITADDTTTFIRPKSTTTTNPSSTIQQCVGRATTLPATPGWDYQCAAHEPFFPHWAYDCGAVPEFYCNLGNNIGSAGAGATLLTSEPNGVIGFTGDENGSFVSLMGPGNIIVTGSVTLLRRTHGYHSRVSCQPQVRRSNSADEYADLGVPTVVSANDIYGLVHITVTGGTYLPSAGDYDYQVTCRLLDDYDANDSLGDWYFVSGNATATTTEL